MDKEQFQTIHEIGFTALQKKLSHYKGQNREEIHLTAGESASVLNYRPKTEGRILSASALYLEGVHFDLVYTPLQYLGHKLLTATLSRIYAMNGFPVLSHVDFAVPNKLSVSMIESICSGFDKTARDTGSGLSIGDITASHQFLGVGVHSSGKVSDAQMVKRDGCKTGDQICVSGDLGAAMAGLRILLREKKSWQESGENKFKPDLQEYEYVVQRQLMPEARADFIERLRESSVKPTSMIELSRGLLNEVQLLMEASQTGCEIYTPSVPISLETRKVADEMKEDVDKYAFYGGEDYEMLFTLRPEQVEKLKADFEDFTVIGEVRDKAHGIKLHTGEGKAVDISNGT